MPHTQGRAIAAIPANHDIPCIRKLLISIALGLFELKIALAATYCTELTRQYITK